MYKMYVIHLICMIKNTRYMFALSNMETISFMNDPKQESTVKNRGRKPNISRK